MSLTKPGLGLAVGGALGLLDGLSGFFEPSLAPVMGSVITFSMLKGLVAGIAVGDLSPNVKSFAIRIVAGIAIAPGLGLVLGVSPGMPLFLGIMLPGMLLVQV